MFSGSCKPRFPVSAVCERGRQCPIVTANAIDGFCVDGFCCDAPCEGQCQACDVANNLGECTPVGTPQNPEPPHPNTDGTFQREDCPGDDNCQGQCIGNADAACVFPDDTTIAQDPTCACPDESCSAPATLTRYFCDGAGSFTEAPERCGGDDGGFRCADASTCKDTCATDDDCIADFICQDGACLDLSATGPSCDGANTLRVAAAPDVDCSPYRCPAGGSACPTACQSVADCVAGKACNAAGECVDPLPAPEVVSCNCSLPGASSPASADAPGNAPPSALALAGLALAAAAARLRRRR
ncbi:MAG TPA: hypothetical protein VLS89_19000 [Candidatus Nanopelagicales bacterium]|nr:hypothetical protein [Candidatus Nanopelagicales bacterium]